MLGVVSIWVTPGTDLTTGVGLLSAGLAFALQQVIVSFAAYVVILRGDTFAVGDRITLGGVRGDVVRLGFLKTTIMEMGRPPSVAATDPAAWVNARQYTGRLVTVTNGVIFTDPVFNYTREFPYLWDEIVLPITYAADRAAAERVLLAAATSDAVVDDPAARAALAAMRGRYAIADAALDPAVYWGSPTTGWSWRCASSSPPTASGRSRTASVVTSSPDSTPPASASRRPPTISSGSPS